MTNRAELLNVVAAVINDGERTLACRRRPHLRAGGLWEFPGGKVEPGETHAAALAREIREELGIAITVEEQLTCVENLESGIRLTCLRAALVGGALPTGSTDHDRLEWLLPHELTDLEWAPADVPTVDLLARRSRRQDFES